MLKGLTDYQTEQQGRMDTLRVIFEIAASGDTYNSALRSFMSQRGIHDDTPANVAMPSLEDRYVATVFNEIALMDKTAQASLRHVRLLLRSPREIYNIREDGHVKFEEVVHTLAYEINSLMDLGVPELVGTSYNYLRVMQSYAGASRHAPDVILGHLNRTANEHHRIAQAIEASPLSDAQMHEFYKPYKDMSDQPRQDYVSSMLKLCGLYLDIAHSTLDRIDLRIQGLDVISRAQAAGLVTLDMAGASSLAQKILETDNMFIRADQLINQSSAQLEDGTWRRRDGAQDYLQSAQAEYAAYPQEFRSICAPA